MTKTTKTSKAAKNTKTSKASKMAASLKKVEKQIRDAGAVLADAAAAAKKDLSAHHEASEQAWKDLAAKSATKSTAKAEPEVETKPETMAACATRMVIEGATNEEILLVLVDIYALPEAHAHYPGWYRAAAVRKGLVTKEFAQSHAH